MRESGLICTGDQAPIRFPPPSAKIKRYVRKGIPPEWRGNVRAIYQSNICYILINCARHGSGMLVDRQEWPKTRGYIKGFLRSIRPARIGK